MQMQLFVVIQHENSIITDIGATTAHLATITREFHVPSIMDVEIGTEVLKDGMEITVDAEENIIYEGKIEELLRYQIIHSSSFEEMRDYKILRKLLKNTATLNLRNPLDKKFLPQFCETYHDIIRFDHEKSIEYLLECQIGGSLRGSPGSKKVQMEIPLDLKLIDIGENMDFMVSQTECKIEEINCELLQVLIEGLTIPSAWSTEPTNMDFASLMSSATGAQFQTVTQNSLFKQNLAIITSNYHNLNLYLGYHFNQVDSYVSDVRNDNYIYFRFLGGMTDITRRSRRVKMISMILEKLNFIVDIKGDLLVARIKKYNKSTMLCRLKMLGYLISYSRQIDVQMRSDSIIQEYVDEFMAGFNNSIH